MLVFDDSEFGRWKGFDTELKMDKFIGPSDTEISERIYEGEKIG